MGLIGGLLNVIFGSGKNALKDTVEVFRQNAEGDADRQHALRLDALKQFGREFEHSKSSTFDRVMDGVNRVPRPALALGTLGLFVAAMIDPIWFAERMQGIALVPEPLWWLLGVVVSFYFGARHQLKSQQFQQSIARSVALAPKIVENMTALRQLTALTPGAADSGHDAKLGYLSVQAEENSALDAWQRTAVQSATK